METDFHTGEVGVMVKGPEKVFDRHDDLLTGTHPALKVVPNACNETDSRARPRVAYLGIWRETIFGVLDTCKAYNPLYKASLGHLPGTSLGNKARTNQPASQLPGEEANVLV